jgi:hypothetical protein
VDIKNTLDCNGEFLCRFEDALKNSMCFTTDGSKREGKSFTQFALLDIKQEGTENIEYYNHFHSRGVRLATAEMMKRIQNYEPGRFILF